MAHSYLENGISKEFSPEIAVQRFKQEVIYFKLSLYKKLRYE
jgi:hypothetical protein